MTRIREEEDCCRACKVTLSFMDSLIALTYFLNYFVRKLFISIRFCCQLILR